jgi:hypothetical protein
VFKGERRGFGVGYVGGAGTGERPDEAGLDTGPALCPVTIPKCSPSGVARKALTLLRHKFLRIDSYVRPGNARQEEPAHSIDEKAAREFFDILRDVLGFRCPYWRARMAHRSQ